MSKLIQILSFLALNFIGGEGAEKNSNKPPYFLSGSDFNSFSIPENFQVGTSVYKLKGIDPEGKKISYSISGPYFSVERDTGIVKLIKQLDRETQSEVETIITITDEAVDDNEEPNTVSLRRVIPIRDYNDFEPTFLGRPYSAEIVETAKVGQTLKATPIVVIDRDLGVNSEVTVTCHRESNQQHENPCDYFGISTVKRAEGNYTVELRLLKPVDYETRKSYALTIVARDGSRDNPLTSNATINVVIKDAQDQPPVFNEHSFTASVEENLGPNVPILLINATDGDSGGNPNDVILTLEKEKFGYFKLLKMGKGLAQLVTSDKPIDRENSEIIENGGYYTFFVRATESLKNHSLGDSSVAPITIMIRDVDDNSPQFNEPYFNLTIPENLEREMALPKLSIIVNDRDVAGSNSQYNLTISNVDNSEGIFDIYPKSSQGRTQVLVKVKNPARLDYDVDESDMRTFIFDIIATVNFIPVSKTTVEVHLDDVNDNFPTFAQSNYRLQVIENAEIGTKIGDIFAIDGDAGDVYGKLKYFLRGFGSENFETDIDEGGIYVRNILDYERQKSYSLSLIARDGGNRESNANILIDVLDVNDNYPQFELTEYYRSIREGSKSFQPQFFVKAYDVDGFTQGNGRVSYSIESENSISGHVFRINNETGEISIHSSSVHSSDTFDGNYELMICAKDFGNPPLKNYTKVIIRVGSENQRPVFQGHFASSQESIPGPPFYRISIYENTTVNSNLTMVEAIDPDGDNRHIRYRLTEPSDSFVIDERSGVIKISPYARLDRDVVESYSIIVNAIDSGIPPETSTVTIRVKILDTNNKAPRFRKASWTAYVPERNKGLEVIKVEALDSDMDARLKYRIVEPIIATTKTGYRLDSTSFDYNSIFHINEDTGSIVLLKNLESSGLYSITLTVKVQDMNAIPSMAEQQTDTCEVILYVQSYKESGPIFLNDEWNLIDKKINLKVTEEMPIGSTIFEFRASDPYTNEEIHDFDMEPQEYFELLENRLVISKSIDYETIERTLFRFDVKAISHDSFSIAHISIEILNINDNSPMFERKEYKAAVLENIKDTEVVLKVKAMDGDKIKNSLDKTLGYSHINYSLSGANSAMFSINNDGEIRLAKNQYLDREKLSVIHFQIVAEDSFGKPLTVKKSFANVTIEVLDINDSAPKFLNAMKNGIINAVLSESSLPNTLIIRLEAYDADEGLSAEVRFELINEGELSKLLTLNAKTGELKTLKFLTGRGRFEPYEVVVRAIDNGNLIPKQQSLFADQILHIYIGDTFQNDGTPFFTQPQDEEASIYENSPVGTKVYQVLANDPDDASTSSGMLRYRIQEDNEDAKFFRIETLSGLVTNTHVLDREVKSKYNVIVEVSDQGDPIQIATRVLKINVLDVDDEKPAFARDESTNPIELSVLEEQSSGIILGNVTAIDRDVGENGAIDYSIVDGNELEFFKLIVANNSALITTTRSIDREEYDKFLLTIKCFKMSSYRQKNAIKNSYARHYDASDLSQIQVSITIMDIDDHVLEFERKNYMIGIRNTIPINTVIYKVQAFDKDSENLPIKYYISNISYVSQYHRKDSKFKDDLSSIFELDNRTGEISLAKSVSDYVDGHFILNVHASNNQFSDSEATVKIFIVRDKSIMKFVFSRAPIDGDGEQYSLTRFAEKLQQKMNTSEIEIVIFDAQVLNKPDKSLDFTSTSSCFKLLRNGNSLSAQETKKILNSEEMKNRLRETYLEYSVDSIDLCSFGGESNTQVAASVMTSSGNWLVFLALLVLMASLVSTLVAFCLFRRAEMSMKSPILHHRISDPDIYNDVVGQNEPITPIYTIM